MLRNLLWLSLICHVHYDKRHNIAIHKRMNQNQNNNNQILVMFLLQFFLSIICQPSTKMENIVTVTHGMQMKWLEIKKCWNVVRIKPERNSNKQNGQQMETKFTYTDTHTVALIKRHCMGFSATVTQYQTKTGRKNICNKQKISAFCGHWTQSALFSNDKKYLI